ncbi:Six-hairpin glycosidase-like protein [Paraphoma chrysanthemicola]|uniref:Six-hairpin glycosidase-like protein n=1 Tax=Paraphoma chrysanthemicola TaxID=798071 RepID=A0A8K0QWI7_9PLEO|nr:Six-hairpin glycosidase-like protein [Paraphoma chrysanthemicola]
MSRSEIVEANSILRRRGGVTSTFGGATSSFTLKNHENGSERAEIVLDYSTCEGGMPLFEIVCASSASCDPVEVEVAYSEGVEGIDHANGDGPFFLFSNAMDTYRKTVLPIPNCNAPRTIRSKYAQRSQRYQRIILCSPNSSVTFSKVGFERIRPRRKPKSTFSCSNELLNRIWRDGASTVDMCTVERGETAPAWEVTEQGTMVHGQHWAPCRHGTRWGDKRVRFQVRVETGGASWAVHMVANGLIFCLDTSTKMLYASEGLAHESTIFPVKEKGRWSLDNIQLDKWLDVETLAQGDAITVSLQGEQVATIQGLDLHPLLGGSPNNTGSVAFGGPCHWMSQFRNLSVRNLDGTLLYENDMLIGNRDRTLSDFQVGINALACTIDGAKRDRACFGGDLHVMGRSIAHSTMDFAAVAGSIELLTSHQSSDGYLGNLAPIQAPVHDSTDEPPTYAFYSLTYAFFLAVAIKDYWMHTGDEKARSKCYSKLERLISFAERFVNKDGILAAPPPMSMHWFPMGGPVFGPSSALNIAYFDALKAVAALALRPEQGLKYLSKAEALKEHIVKAFYDSASGVFQLGKSLPHDGICQDVKGYAITTDLIPPHTEDLKHLSDPDSTLPRAFRGLKHWDKANVVSPYATGFAVEALFHRETGASALDLMQRVWGPMTDPTSLNYSGGHWEAMKPDGTPHGHDTSLMHGWSTWPVFLMPRYLAGLYPIEAGWKVFGVSPVLAGLDFVECSTETVAGTVKVDMMVNEAAGHGAIRVSAPYGTRFRLQAPKGWTVMGPSECEGTGDWMKFFMSKPGIAVSLESKSAQIALRKATSVESEEKMSLPVGRKRYGRVRTFLSQLKTAIC